MKLLDLMKAEPVLTMGAVQASLGLVVAFGLALTAAQVGAIMVFSAAVLSVIVRRKVTPYQDNGDA